VTRVAREVGTEGKLGGQAEVPGVAGTWKDLTDNVNSMAGNLTGQVRNIAEVDDRRRERRPLAQDHRRRAGEILELKNTINTMVDQLNGSPEVTRVAREVGTEGKLGGQAQVPGVAGTWKDLTDNVNSMAGNLTGQVRNIAEVTTAVANGDLAQDHRRREGRDPRAEEHHQHDGRPAQRLRGEVTRVAREVGTEGKLGGQAEVPGRRGHLEGPHRQRQLDGRQPHRPGAQHRRGDDRRRERRPVEEDHGRRARRDPRAEGTPSTRWSTSCASPPK
jgi:HAMP domain-containing protein